MIDGRGRPIAPSESCWTKFGHSVALQAGDDV